MSVARELLVIVAPLRLTLWVLAIATAVILVLIAIGVSRHYEAIRADRRRERVEAELGPVFSRFLQGEDLERLAAELRRTPRRADQRRPSGVEYDRRGFRTGVRARR